MKNFLVEIARKNLLEKIAIFVTAGLIGAYVLWLWGVPWNLIWIIIPWLAIPGIVLLAFSVGKIRTTWFNDHDKHEKFRNDLWDRAVRCTESDNQRFKQARIKQSRMQTVLLIVR